MRNPESRIPIVFLWVFLFLPWAQAQGRGVVQGKLVNGTDPKIIGKGVEIDVIQLGQGMSILKSSVTDSAAGFRVEGLPVELPLMIRANYQSVNYHGRVQFDASAKADVRIEIFETTESMKDIRVDEVRLGFQLEAPGDHLRVLETYSFVNETNPKKTFMSMTGSFRFSKAAGLTEPPQMSVQGPGGAMPLRNSPLESPDGQSYYSLYPLRPGTTKFEIDYALPYRERTYRYARKFYHDLASYQIGVLPQDLGLVGDELSKVHTDTDRNFTVYSGGPVKAGTQVTWTLSGGTPVAAAPASESGESRIKTVQPFVGRNAGIIAPLLLMALIAVLWYAFNAVTAEVQKGQDPRTRELRERRERLLDFIATLDNRHENKALDRKEYVRQREQAKRQLRRVMTLLGKKN